MADDLLENSVKALVSLKEGIGDSFNSSPSPSRRGHPTRIRKKNRLFFNDDEDTSHSPIRSPKKQTKLAPSSLPSTLVLSNLCMSPGPSTPDKRAAQTIGVRLKNMLKLPKAHKWVCYEWFYSNLDAPLFQGENDFCSCLKDCYPQLRTRRLRRIEWCKIRRLLGKPRRCSSAFFAEERTALEQRRTRIRLLQQRKLAELSSFKDLPDEVPMHLVIGTKVTARLRKPQDGLFTGTVEALDTLSNCYRITFDKPGLGTHSIPDYEVLSSEPQETIALVSFQQKHRPQRPSHYTPPRFIPGLSSPGAHLDNDPLLSESPLKGSHLMSLDNGTYGGFPIRFLALVTRLHKILRVKKDSLQKLADLNLQAEKLKSYQQSIGLEFQKRYADVVIELEQLNKDLNEYLIEVQQYCQDLAPEKGLPSVEQPAEIQTKCQKEAQMLVQQVSQTIFNKKSLKNESMLELITNLTSLMLQIRTFAENDFNSFECRMLQDSLKQIKDSLDMNNLNCFQNNVEVHVNHVQSGLSQTGNLYAFSATEA